MAFGFEVIRVLKPFVSHCQEEKAARRLATVSLGPDPIVRQLAPIYRKDKALSKAALGFIEVTLKNAAMDGTVRAPVRVPSRWGAGSQDVSGSQDGLRTQPRVICFPESFVKGGDYR